MRLRPLIIGAICMGAAGMTDAAPVIIVGNYVLIPNESGQSITLTVSGGDLVTGFNLRAQIGDGLGPNPEPVFQSVGFGGGIWDAFPTWTLGGPVVGARQYAQASVLFSATGQNVAANGNLVTLTIDTTGLSTGRFALSLAGTDIGADSAFIGSTGNDVSATITNGTITLLGLSNWIAASGSWTSGSCWSAGEPNASMRANISNGGTVTISQAGRICSSLAVGSSLGQSGTVNMTGGSLTSGVAYVGYKGTGAFTQSGGTLYTSDLVIGGDMIQRGGAGTFTISGGNTVVNGSLRVWNGSTINLGLGTLVSADPNHPALDVFNEGMVDVGDSNGAPMVYCFRDVTGNGDIVIGPGATVWMESLEQNSVRIDAGGTLILAAENPQLYAATAMRNYETAVPEPCSLVMLSLAGLVLAMHRKQRSQ